ncbi:MAG: hypothetical protein QM764_14900 [Chitinophagaceae bacterium]
MALISVLALSFPLLMLIFTGLVKHKSFPVLCIYYALMIFDNCVGEGYLPIPESISRYTGTICNMLDPLLMLGFIIYFSRSPLIKKRIAWLIACLVVFEIFSVIVFGFNKNGLAVALGPGLTAMLLLSVYFFLHQVKLSVTKGKAIGKAIMISALAFMYGCYFIIYLVSFVFKNPDLASSLLILYFINLFSCSAMAIGILIESQRVKKLNELLIARKEMAEIYSSISYRSVKPKVFTAFRKRFLIK